MPDFFAFIDGIMNAVTAGRAAQEVSDENSDQNKSQKNEKVEATSDEIKDKTDQIIEERLEAMKQRRAEQAQLSKQHHHRQKR